ncbi:MAG: prolyl oligopeptidase family serine peptidase [Bacteroidota bacterium]
MRFFILLSNFLLCAHFSFSQKIIKKAMTPEVYAEWKTIERPTLSNNGKWVAYQLKPGEGDPLLKVYHTDTQREYTFERGEQFAFSEDAKFLVFHIVPPADTLKAMKRRKVKKKNLPKDSLGIYDLEKKILSKVPNVRSYQLPQKWNGYLAYHRAPQIFEKGDSTAVRPKKKESNKNGTTLTIRTLDSGKEENYTYVKNYKLAEEGEKMIFWSTGNDSTFLNGIYYFDFRQGGLTPMHRQEGEYKKMVCSTSGDRVAFLSNVDTTKARIKPFRVHLWENGADSASVIFQNENELLQKDWIVSQHEKLSFSEDGNRLFFGVSPQPILPDTTLLDEEIVNVEVWSYTDKVLYTQQESRLADDKKQAYLMMYDLKNKKAMSIADATVDEVSVGNEGKGRYALGYNEKPYLEKLSWEGGPTYKDLYIKDLEQGGRWIQFHSKVRGTPRLSPNGNYAYWYSTPDTAWFTYHLASQKLTQVTNNKISKFYDELNDRPMHPSPYRMAGWTLDDEYMLIYDRYDIWKIHPQYKTQPVRLTKGREDAAKTVYRYLRLDREERAINLKEGLFLHTFSEVSKREGYGEYRHQSKAKDYQLVQLMEGNYALSRRPQIGKGEDARNVFLFTKENFQMFPDLRIVKNWKFNKEKKISNANPQQYNYKWATIEPYTWTSLDGQQLNGLLVKPEDFDPNKKYPMIVNFYERSSNRLHRHRAPYPHRSTINYSYYASRGYLIFNPDVPYKIGYPGESAYNAVIPGVTSLVEKGFVDKDNIALQGHSWGGYQIAYIVTRTNMFKCAESGAPVVNMISAYGGIRWGSGMSRMFQYERTQSRIGGTLWEYPLRYIENSPIFTADKIQTPLLILHNDKDGAVPWYQGIEFFVALRRLGKPAWMLNYNDEPHWPVKLQNRLDFNLRMQQFFDHYLQSAEKPAWMKRGVPAMEKGILQGLEMESGQ